LRQNFATLRLTSATSGRQMRLDGGQFSKKCENIGC
jgi:hypothetical protein